jgi:hypothetical protein
MWGNRLGWILAAVITAVLCATIALLIQLEQPTPPTSLTADPANLAVIDLPIPPEAAWPALTSTDHDAGDLYRQVIQLWSDDQQFACDRYVQSPTGQPPEPIRFLLQTRHFRAMRLFADNPGAVVNYDNSHPDLDALASAGEAACTIGLSLGKRHRHDDAMPYLEAAFNLGRNLYNERIVYAEFQRGMELMGTALAATRSIEPPGSALSNQLGRFDAERQIYEQNQIDPIWQAINSADPGIIAANAGDVFVLAARSQEPMWRVEATLKIGRFRFDVNRYGDEATANRRIAQLLTDPSPAVAAAAAAARDLTIEKYRQIGGPG